MSKGYIFLGGDKPEKNDNIIAAYMLSLSLKVADPDCKTCVAVFKLSDVPAKFENGFDFIIELPYGHTDQDNIFLDFWQLLYCTPFDESMFVNTYSLAIDNIASLWEMNKFGSLVFAKANDFRGDNIYDPVKFKAQTQNDIISFDSDVIYFNKDKLSSEFFKMADPFFKNWREIYLHYLPKYRPDDFDFTLMVNIVLHSLGEEWPAVRNFDYTDLNINAIGAFKTTDEWLRSLKLYITDTVAIKVNNHRQTGIMVYGNPKILPDNILRKINDNHRKQTIKIPA
jgi:hypothetical protein